MVHISRRVVFLGVAVIVLLAFAACGGDDNEVPTGDATGSADKSPNREAAAVSVSGADFSFDAPDTIASGPTTLEFSNEGQEDHELHVMQLNDGVAQHQFQQALHQQGLDAALEMASERGHVASIGPGENAEATADLPEGEYVLICQIESPDDGVSHALKGMAKPLRVTAAP